MHPGTVLCELSTLRALTGQACLDDCGMDPPSGMALLFHGPPEQEAGYFLARKMERRGQDSLERP